MTNSERKNSPPARSLCMLAGIALFAVLQAASALSQTGLESFQIGRFDGRSWTIADVQPISPSEVRARFIQVDPVCDTYHVSETDYVFQAASVAQLANSAALCMSPQRTANFVALSTRKNLNYAIAVEQIIAARCRSDLLIHRLPPTASLRFAALQARVPAVAALFTLADELKKRSAEAAERDGVNPDSAFTATRVTNRALLESAAAEIRSGKYDLILPEIPLAEKKDGNSKLADLMPSPEEAAAGVDHDFGELLDRDHFAFEQLPEITYPQMARVAHIEGDVAAELAIDTQTGKVLSTFVTSGHPILRQAVIAAAATWVLSHPYFGPEPIPIVVRFKIRCPLVVDSSQSTVTPIRKRRQRLKKKKSNSAR